MKKFIVNAEEQIVFIGVADRMKQALEFKERIEKEVQPKSVIIMDVFPSDNINIGPGLMTGFFFGIKISERLGKVRLALNEIIKKL